MRIILYTGKGGVGKTCVAAATAVKLADEGKKVIVISTDQAHSLSDAFDKKLTWKPEEIFPGLDAMEVDVVNESEEAWGNLKDYMRQILTSRVEDGIEAEELLVFPGLEELFSLFKILDIYENMDYDTLIVDCAPTGETLGLLRFPEVFGTMLDTMIPVKRKLVKTAGPLIEKVMKLPMPEDNVFDDLERLMDKLERLQAIMLDKEIVSIRIVSTPEKIVIKETKRNYTWLQLYDYNVDAVIVNKVYPKEALNGYFNKWVKLQDEGLSELEDSFRDIKVFKLMLQRQELRTLDTLRAVNSFYKDYNPQDVFSTQKIFSFYLEDDIHKMEISLPFADKSEMDLSQANGEVRISIKNEKRCFMLPDQLKGKDIAGAKFENGSLKIDFV